MSRGSRYFVAAALGLAALAPATTKAQAPDQNAVAIAVANASGDGESRAIAIAIAQGGATSAVEFYAAKLRHLLPARPLRRRDQRRVDHTGPITVRCRCQHQAGGRRHDPLGRQPQLRQPGRPLATPQPDADPVHQHPERQSPVRLALPAVTSRAALATPRPGSPHCLGCRETGSLYLSFRCSWAA